ncbi:MAG: YgcG family protein [Nitrosomonadales bacterium]|nr:YgcG family protein [Nitrosomonadales bacterium]
MRRWLLIFLLLLLPCTATAEVAVPSLTARVTDLTGTLSAEQRGSLESRLQAYETQKGSQIAVLLLPTTQPETIEQYSIRVVEQWKLGRTKVDDGVLLLIAKDDRALRIEVGYGLEGVLPDAIAHRIIAEDITPLLKQGDFFGGINAGVTRIMAVVQGEALPAPQASDDNARLENLFPALLFGALLGGTILRRVLGRVPGALVNGGLIGIAALLFGISLIFAVFLSVMAFAFTLGGGHRGFGGYGSGGYGGYGGGSFGGGGGGFGGGGASGRW